MGAIGRKLVMVGVVVTLTAGAARAVGTGGLYVEDGIYRVETFQALGELERLVASAEEAFTGEVWLMADVEAGDMTPIGDSRHMFVGTFDGRGHVISGLKMEGCGEFAGLFGYVGIGGCVKNLTVKNATVAGSRYTGATVAYNAGTISGCKVVDCRVIGTGNMEYGSATGGVAGISAGDVVDCVNQGSVVFGARNVGGVVGSLCAGRLERCVSTGSAISRSDGHSLTGGIAGGVQTGGSMVYCVSAGTASAPQGEWTGGLAGGVLSGEIKRCISFCKVAGRAAGSVAGYAARRAQLVSCRYVESGLPAVGEGKESGVYRVKPTDFYGWLLEPILNMGRLNAAKESETCMGETDML